MGKKHNNIIKIISFAVLILLFIVPAVQSKADTASAISIGVIDYENDTMQIYKNGNSTVYYSTDKETWTEVEAAFNRANGFYTMDISWISATSEVTLYFKGDVVKTRKAIIIPAQNSEFKVIYDKVEGEFIFEDTGDAEYFEWRKTADYTWTKVSLDECSSSYTNFITTMEYLRVNGASIIFRLPQEAGTGISNPGKRPSITDTIAVTVRSAAPTVKVNSSKLTLNTTTAMEYYDSSAGVWVECESTMSLEDITPKVLYENGAKEITLMLRKAATTSAPYSKTQYLTIPAQDAKPTIGDNSSDITYYYLNSKLILQFNKASVTNVYEYTIVKSNSTFRPASANWKAVNSTKLITLSVSTAPDDCMIYIRKKGTDANITKGIALILSSAINSFTVKY